MKKIEFNFDDNSFNKLFPFYILIDPNLKIIGLGKSLVKIFPYVKLNDLFTTVFEIKRPYLENPSFENILAIFDQLVVIGNTTDNIDLSTVNLFLRCKSNK